ncbi:hypothetical protein OG500_00925 [Kitasatospora sp. NBC_01250]|uniref:hypothetical protein n=1 Tax=Kitasatospora sp. NBC_01250 TaxID=2903571 RepID=UPI002E36038B|nr:hypothetical protein [Kitasatospora sp. NBC_01250]
MARKGPEDRTARFDREHVIRVLTFWLRPAFALRVVNRFQKTVGFDRAMSLASSGLTALIPLAILLSSFLDRFGQGDLADRIVKRYGLTGGGAEAVRHLFSFPAADPGTSVLGLLFLLISALSFSRAAQRLFETAWDLTPLSVRNTKNGLLWSLSLAAYLVVVGWLHALLGRGRLDLAAVLCQVPVTVLFLLWSGRLLSARRIDRWDLAPFTLLAAGASAAYSVAATVYLPRLFSSYATRFGAVGAVFAMLTALFGLMFVLVGSCAVGREVRDEMGRIKRGLRPPDDEVRRQWAELVARMREGWQAARMEHLGRRPPGDRGRS